MMWLIVIVQLGRAAPRQRRRVSGELAAAGAVSISEGVWAVPDTPFHRTAVDGCTRRAVDAGGDIVILNTSPENSPTHDVLEAALTESLTAEAADLARRWEALTGAHFADTAEDPDDAERQKDCCTAQNRRSCAVQPSIGVTYSPPLHMPSSLGPIIAAGKHSLEAMLPAHRCQS